MAVFEQAWKLVKQSPSTCTICGNSLTFNDPITNSNVLSGSDKHLGCYQNQQKNLKKASLDKGDNAPTNPALWSQWKSKAKSKFDVYPPAYANAWAAKGYKKAGGGWKKKGKGGK
jgi:hypothetical protein